MVLQFYCEDWIVLYKMNIRIDRENELTTLDFWILEF